MIYILQAENRDTPLFNFLMQSISSQADEMGAVYIKETDPMDRGSEIAPVGSHYTPNYAKFVVLRELVGTLEDGDIILYLDSDIYARQNALQSLIDYIQDSKKSIFYVTYVSKVASPILGIKVTKTTKAIIDTMNIEVLQETRKTAYGEAITSDEEIWHTAMDYNHLGFMELIDVLPAKLYGAILQKEMFGNELDHIQVDKNTKLIHFMGTSKDFAIEYLKKNDGVEF